MALADAHSLRASRSLLSAPQVRHFHRKQVSGGIRQRLDESGYVVTNSGA